MVVRRGFTVYGQNTCKNALLYACESIFLSKQCKQDLDKLQARLIKCITGIGPSHKTTPLLQALKIQKISDAIDYNNIVLLRNIISTSSAARHLNCHMLQYNRNCKGTLFNRVSLICQTENIDQYRVMFDDCYFTCRFTKSIFFKSVDDGQNGTIDSIRMLLKDMDVRSSTGSNAENIQLLRLLLRAF